MEPEIGHKETNLQDMNRDTDIENRRGSQKQAGLGKHGFGSVGLADPNYYVGWINKVLL